MGGLKHKLFAAFLAVAAAAAPGMAPGAAESRLDPGAVIERSEAAIGRLVGPHVLTDSNGAPLALESFRGRPLVVSLVYTSCSSVCPVTTQHVLQAVRKARRVVGEDAFAVLTLGFLIPAPLPLAAVDEFYVVCVEQGGSRHAGVND